MKNFIYKIIGKKWGEKTCSSVYYFKFNKDVLTLYCQIDKDLDDICFKVSVKKKSINVCHNNSNYLKLPQCITESFIDFFTENELKVTSIVTILNTQWVEHHHFSFFKDRIVYNFASVTFNESKQNEKKFELIQRKYNLLKL